MVLEAEADDLTPDRQADRPEQVFRGSVRTDAAVCPQPDALNRGEGEELVADFYQPPRGGTDLIDEASPELHLHRQGLHRRRPRLPVGRQQFRLAPLQLPPAG
jgi:hypothetical protein